MELGLQSTRYPSPDEQRMNSWYSWKNKDKKRSRYWETKLFHVRFVHPEIDEKTCD